MPADDLVLNVRQIAGYPTTNVVGSDAILIQRGGLGGAYLSVSPPDLVGTALASGGDMAIAGGLSVQSVSGGSLQFSNAALNLLSAQKACIVDFAATYGSIGGVTIATMNDLAAQYAALRAATVWSFNGRGGDVRLWIDDIVCAGGAPIYSPCFQGLPRAETPPPWSNSGRLATTCFVQQALSALTLGYAPLDSPNFTGIPTAPTAALGSSDGQLATTAFVQNAVTESTTGVASFNSRTGAVLLTAADLTSAGGALLASPVFTGLPSAPTAGPGTNTTQLATTQFVAAAVAALAGGVTSFNSRTGDVILTAADVAAIAVASFNGRVGAVMLLANDVSAAGGALLAGPAFTGAPSAPTAALGTSTTQLATTAFVQTAVTAVTAGVTSWNARSGAVTLQSADLAAVGGALLASPVFTGSPQAPTAAPGTNSGQLATTAFVAAAITAGMAGVASFNGRTGAVTLLVNDLSAAGGALIASPAFTGIPTAPTAALGVSTNQLATTAFVQAALPVAATANPLVNGTAGPGSSTAWSRGDHVHPTDTSRAAATALANYLPLAGGIVSGALTVTGPATFNGNTTANVYSAVQGSQPPTVVLCSNPSTVEGSLVWTSGLGIYLNNASGGGQLSIGGSNNLIFTGTASLPGGGPWLSGSDARIKTVEGDYGTGLEAVCALAPVIYRYKGNDARAQGEPSPNANVTGRTYIGLIAQAVETIMPEMVAKQAGFIDGAAVTDLLTLDTGPLIFALVNAVKTLAARVTALEAA